jgi:uncharacterized membrane protein
LCTKSLNVTYFVEFVALAGAAVAFVALAGAAVAFVEFVALAGAAVAFVTLVVLVAFVASFFWQDASVKLDATTTAKAATLKLLLNKFDIV